MLLNEMGFIWDVHEERFRRNVEGIVAYRELHGDFLIPNKFVIPHGDPRWPSTTWGLKIGGSYAQFRQRSDLSLRQIQLLSDYGIPLDPQKEVMAERIVGALEAYKRYMNIEPGKEFIVPAKFKVPHGDVHWDPLVWGLQLGYVVLNIRHYNHYPSHHDRFRAVGLRLDKGRTRAVVAERILAALKTYKRIMDIAPGKEFTVHKDFNVPCDDARWDAALWGMRLGVAAQNIRYGGHYQKYHEQFRAMGLRMGKGGIGSDVGDQGYRTGGEVAGHEGQDPGAEGDSQNEISRG
jgi:hypothetical protein